MTSMDAPPDSAILDETSGEKPDMDAFRAEIKRIFIEGNVVDDVNIDFKDLIKADAIIWEKIKNHEKEPLTRADYFAYMQEVGKSTMHARQRFAAFINNKFQSILGNEEIERRKMVRPE